VDDDELDGDMLEGDVLEGDVLAAGGEGDDDEGPQILFISEDALTEDEDGVAVLCCPTCGETLSAGAGDDAVEEEADIDVLCPVCGCSLQEVETDYDSPVMDH
jgi:hypothetical protein